MEQTALRRALRELAAAAVPDDLDGWPAIRGRLGERRRRPARRQAPATAAARAIITADRQGRWTSRDGRPSSARAGKVASGAAIGLLLLLVAGALALVVPVMRHRGAGFAPTVTAPGAPTLLFGFGSPDPARRGGLTSVAWPSGRVLGQVGLSGTNLGGAWALAPDGRRAYLVDRARTATGPVGPWQLIELDAPSMRVLRRVDLPDGADIGGYGQLVAVSRDGTQVYVAVRRVFDPPRSPTRVAQYGHDADYPLAVYDVAQGRFVRLISLGGVECGLAQVFAVPDGRVLVLCRLSQTLHLLDPRAGTQLTALSVNGDSGVPSPDGRRFWVVARTGALDEIDLATYRVTRTLDLASLIGGAGFAPIAPPRLAANGSRLFVLAAPVERARSFGMGTLVWIVDTATLTRVGVVHLPAPAADITPLPDGSALLVDALVTNAAGTATSQTDQVLLVVDAADGRELRRWTGPLGQLVVR